MLGTLVMAGGAGWIGYRFYAKWRDRLYVPLIDKLGIGNSVSVPPIHASPLASPSSPYQHELISASCALGVRAGAGLLNVPLQWIAIPLLAYMGIPSARKASQTLLLDRQLDMALVETTVLIACLASGATLIGSAGFTAYYVAKFYYAQTTANRTQPPLSQAQAVRIRRDGHEQEILSTALQAGDIVLLQSSEVVPSDGQVAEGVAWLEVCEEASVKSRLICKSGSFVKAQSLVLVGEIVVKVS